MADKEIQKRNSNIVSGFFTGLLRFVQKLFHRQTSLIKPGTSWQDIQLDISAEVTRYLEMRHVLEDEVKQVIFYAETTGDKLYQPDANRYLGKLKIGKVTFYADYSYGDNNFIVRYGYAHRSQIVG